MKLDERQVRPICTGSVSEFVNHFPRLKYLLLWGVHSDALLHKAMEKFHILQELELSWCSNREIFQNTKMEKQAGGFAIAKEVLSSLSFKNLKILKVSSCHAMKSLMPASTAKSLAVLEEMSVRYCAKVTQIIEGEEEVEITFRKLKILELIDLGNLTSFYDGKCPSNFPMLEKILVMECPSLMLFSPGAFSMPNFKQLEHNEKAFDFLRENTVHECKCEELNKLIESNLVWFYLKVQ